MSAKGIELFAELAVGAHGARDAPVERIEHDREADGDRRVVEIGDTAVESREDRVIAAEKVRDREHAGQEIDAAAKSMIAE